VGVGLIVSIVVAGISAGVAGIAIWQALSAKKAAQAAERQADAAEAAARAAQEQVELMRRQFDAEDANRREARGPEFGIMFRGASRGLPERTVHFEFAQNSGPALQTIQVSAIGEGILGLYDPQTPTTEGPPSAQPAVELGPVSKGGKVAVHVACDPAVQATVPVRFTLVCHAEGSTDTWQRSYTADAHGPAKASFVAYGRSLDSRGGTP
jgi:hypothetical protein